MTIVEITSFSEIDRICAESARIYRSDPALSRAMALEARQKSVAAGYALGEATSLHRLAVLVRADGKIEEGLTYGFEAEKLFASIGEESGVLRCKNNRAGFLKDAGKTTEAILLYLEVADAFCNRGDRANELSALIGFATCYEVAGDTAGFLETSLTALMKCRAAGLPLYEVSCLLAVAGGYADFAQWDRAIDYYQQAVTASQNNSDIHAHAVALSNLGYAYWRTGHNGQAIVEYEKALAYCQEHEHTFMEISSASNLGYLLIARDLKMGLALSWEESRGHSLAQCAVQVAREGPYPALLAQAILKLGDIYALVGMNDRSLHQFEEALSLSDGFGLIQIEALEKLSKSYEARGEFERANTYLTQLLGVRKNLFDERNSHLLRAVEIKLEAERAKVEREVLVRECDGLQKASAEKEQRLAVLALTLAERHQLLDWVRTELIKHQKTETNGELLRAVLRAVERHVQDSEGWSAFEFEFRELTGDFSQNLLARCPALSPTEIRVSALLRLGLSTKQTASLLRSSARTIDWHRASIRKKLNIAASDNLQVVFQSI